MRQCDGGKPACQRCNARHISDSCHYDVHSKTAKDQMMREIRQLQQKSQDLETQRDSLEERNAWIEQIISSLKEDGLYIEIINRLKRGDSHQVIAEWLGRPLISESELSPDMASHLNIAIEKYHRDLVGNKDPRYWTNVTRG